MYNKTNLVAETDVGFLFWEASEDRESKNYN